MQIPQEWTEIIERLRALPRGATAVLLGGTDRGKSTFTAMAARSLAAGGLRVAVVDADIGQGEIGPPGVVGVAWASAEASKLSELTPAALFFVGAFGAAALPLEHVTATVNAVRHARLREPDRILCDTTGYIAGPTARRLKTAKMSLIRPELILVFGSDTDPDAASLAAAASAVSGAEIVPVPVPAAVQRKPQAMRATLRRTRLASYFGQTQETLTLPMTQVSTLGATIGTGTPIAVHLSEWAGKALRLPVRYGEIASDVLSLFVDGTPAGGWEQLSGPIADHFKVRAVRVVSLASHEGVLLGLQGEDGHLLTLARCVGFDRDQQGIVVQTPQLAARAALERTKLIAFGRARIDASGAAITELKPGEL